MGHHLDADEFRYFKTVVSDQKVTLANSFKIRTLVLASNMSIAEYKY